MGEHVRADLSHPLPARAFAPSEIAASPPSLPSPSLPSRRPDTVDAKSDELGVSAFEIAIALSSRDRFCLPYFTLKAMPQARRPSHADVAEAATAYAKRLKVDHGGGQVETLLRTLLEQGRATHKQIDSLRIELALLGSDARPHAEAAIEMTLGFLWLLGGIDEKARDRLMTWETPPTGYVAAKILHANQIANMGCTTALVFTPIAGVAAYQFGFIGCVIAGAIGALAFAVASSMRGAPIDPQPAEELEAADLEMPEQTVDAHQGSHGITADHKMRVTEHRPRVAEIDEDHDSQS